MGGIYAYILARFYTCVYVWLLILILCQFWTFLLPCSRVSASWNNPEVWLWRRLWPTKQIGSVFPCHASSSWAINTSFQTSFCHCHAFSMALVAAVMDTKSSWCPVSDAKSASNLQVRKNPSAETKAELHYLISSDFNRTYRLPGACNLQKKSVALKGAVRIHSALMPGWPGCTQQILVSQHNPQDMSPILPDQNHNTKNIHHKKQD